MTGQIAIGALIGVAALILAPAAATAAPDAAVAPAALRVCADPDNLPFSDDKGQGLENKVAEILAADLHQPIAYTWQSQRRGFLRRSLNAGTCDVVIGAPTGLAGLATTRPYYRSAYVFLSRQSLTPQPRSLDDPGLRTWRIGLHALGMEGANTPAAQALAARGIVDKIEGFPVWGDDEGGPTAGLSVAALAKGDVDVASVWGPFAGYFGKKYAGQLSLTPILADPCLPAMAFAYDIAVGVRTGDNALRSRRQEARDRNRPQIAQVLQDFAVPLVSATPQHAPATGASACASKSS